MSLHVKNLFKSYPTRAGELPILRGVDLELADGEALAILGPSGSGKSTLLHILGALDRPTSGEYRLGDLEPFRFNDQQLAHFRNRNVGFVFQEHHLLPQCSAMENVLVPTLAAQGVNLGELEARAKTLLDRVGLSERLEHRPAELSGGERQRVAVARSLILKPTLLLADEPTGNLDRKTASLIGELLLDLQRQEKTMLIVVTHSLELARVLPRQLEMNDGKLESLAGGRP